MNADAATLSFWVFVLCCLLLALSASAQAALIYIDRARMRHMLDEGTPRARALGRLLATPSSTFSTVLVFNTLVMGGATVSAFELDQQWFVQSPTVAVVLGIVEVLVLILVQFIGRLVGVSRPEAVALVFIRPVELLAFVLRPTLWLLMQLEGAAGRLLGLRRAEETPAEAEERIRHLVEDNADLEEDEREMIASVIELGEQPIREVMVPRMDVTALPVSASVREVLDSVVATGHSRIPLFDGTIDNITGVMYAKDVLKHLRDGSQDAPAAPLAREPYYVPETKKVDELLQEMREKRIHLAVVLDEYGGTAGLISIEDLIEEIVGEIQDEYDLEEEAPIQQVSDTEALFDGRVSIRDVNDTLDLHIADDDFDTLGGLLYHELGKVPSVGDAVTVDGGTATVLSTSGRRVKQVRVQRLPPPTPVEAAD